MAGRTGRPTSVPPRLLSLLLSLAATAFAQTGPVIYPRGIVNTFTQEPAPSPVAPGGLISINGINLNSSQVTIAGEPATVISDSSTLIVAQVPSDLSPGLANVIVQNAKTSSLPILIPIVAAMPSVQSADATGMGPISGNLSGNILTFSAAGLTGTDLHAFVGGLPAQVSATPSATSIGQYDVTLQIPSAAQPGDNIMLRSGAQLSNLTTFQTATDPGVRFLPLPSGSPAIQTLAGSDLRGGFVSASAPPGSDGCWPSYVLDFNQSQQTPVSGCVSGGPPFVPTGQGVSLGVISGNAPSSLLELFWPDSGNITSFLLSSPVSQLSPGVAGSVLASVATTPPSIARIDESSGNISYGPDFSALHVDLGNGLSKSVASPVPLDSGNVAVLIGDDPTSPTQVEFAVVDPTGQPLITASFPSGWTFLLAPQPPPITGAMGGQTLTIQIPRVTAQFDTVSRSLYVLSQSADSSTHALVAFSAVDGSTQVLPFPANWFAAACSPSIPLNSLPVSRKLVVAGATTNNVSFQSSCAATAFIVFDLVHGSASALSSPKPFAASGAGQSVKEFVVAPDSIGQLAADTLVVFDGLANAVFTIAVPFGVNSFAGLAAVPALGALVSTGVNAQPGDSGLILFDLVNQASTSFPVPAGFTSVEFDGAFPATRKLVARGLKPNNTGSQFILFDLQTLDAGLVANPAGTGFVGAGPSQSSSPGGPITIGPGGPVTGGGPGGPGSGTIGTGSVGPPAIIHANPNANSVAALCFDANGNQTGIMSFRVP
jgi:hypothetical protein